MSLTQRALKDLQALRLKKHRLAQSRYMVEGARLVSEAVSSAPEVEQVLLTTRFARLETWTAIEATVQFRGLEVTYLTDAQSQRLADTQHPQGIFAVVRLPREPSHPTQPIQPPVLILDDITDPGNMGTLLRTADWFAIPTVWVSQASADVFNPKVLRGGMGAHFHIPNLWQGDLAVPAQQISAEGIILLGATMDGRPLDQIAAPGQAWALVVGSEAHGLSPFWRGCLDEAVTIPGAGRAESLNASVATGIILHYLSHQQR